MAKLLQRLKKILLIPVKLYKLVQRGESHLIGQKIRSYLGNRVSHQKIWSHYKKSFNQKIRIQVLQKIETFSNPPLISILMPVYNTPEKWLREALGSVSKQLYPYWELCIADDNSTATHIRQVLEEFAQQDSRIKLFFRKENGGVSKASNSALKLVSGKFVVLMDHDDLLEEQALFRVAESIIEDSPDMFYSDEACISEKGSIINFALRPTFSLEYLRSHPYIVHLVGFRTQLLQDIDGFNEELHVSQDYDLILRASEKSRCIVHIPEVLYQWRVHNSSTGHKTKDAVMNVSKNVITQHLKRCNEPGLVQDGVSFNFFQVRYPLKSQPKVAIIIPTKNHGSLVHQCVKSIETTGKNILFDIIIINNASDDLESLTYFESIEKDHKVLTYEDDFNFSAINNWAVVHLDDSYSHYLFCNNDIEAIEEGWLERMMELAQKPDIGIVGAKLLYPDRLTIQHAGVCVGMKGLAEHYGKFMDNKLPNGDFESGYQGAFFVNRELSAVTAACLLMRKDAFDKVGGYDENLAVGFGDVDLCLRTRQAGYRIIFCSQATLVHHESYTRGKSYDGTDPHPQDSNFFLKKWQSYINSGDIYFNPNLSQFSTNWEVKNPIEAKIDIQRRVYRGAKANESFARTDVEV